MKKSLYLSLATTAFAGVAFGQNADLPPAANAGECFARVLVPETTEIVTEQVVDIPESTEISVIPAQYETVTQTVLVKEETVEYTTIPAVFETVTEQIIDTPERTDSLVVPAQFETFEEQVLIRPAYTTWKPGAGLYGRGAAGTNTQDTAGHTGELLCKVEIPAQYDTVTRTRLVSEERTETTVIPATYRTVTRQVVATPPQIIENVVPAVFEEVQVQKIVSDTREEVNVVPATFKTVEKRVVTGGGGLEWREVLCDTNTTPAKIAEIQSALTAAGYNVPADGDFGPGTLRAMEAYQRDKGLPVGYLTVSTVQSLGVSAF